MSPSELIDRTSAEASTEISPEGTSPRRARRAFGVIMTLALVATWFIFLRPDFLGGSTAYVLVSGNSMEPTLSDGDFVIARQQDVYRRRDIAVYRIPEGDVGAGHLVIHRIVGGSADEGYVLRGDNRTTNDLWRPHPDEIAGKLRMHIPLVGKAVPYLRSPLIVAAFAGVMAFLFIYNSGDRPRGEGQARRR